ncbi:MAG: respiratory nitrate reductase subunit gamma [Rhizobiales bacterium]|nr:respiratory nitrate reductase subunit gamma [Hyphomicrobiales bacterium]OJY04911.1 MAG: respiratory nitrate reductase subunit gamma [Rhizobiales bacterium 63-22]
MAYIHTFLFGIYPYIALSVLALGSIFRYDREPYTWRSGSSQLLRRRQLMWGSVLFHAGVLFIFFGHFVGLLTPVRLIEAMGISHEAKQILAVVTGGIAGLIAIVGASMLLHRRLFDPRVRASSRPTDTLIIILLWIQLLLGLSTIPVSLQHIDGLEMVKFMNWAQGILTFDRAASSYIVNTSIVFRIHIVLGLTILLLFPFTRLVHMLSAPVRYIWRPGYQVVRERNHTAVPAHRRVPAE